MSNLNVNKTIEEKDKFAIVIKNISLLNNKYLNQSNYFTLKNVFAYTIDKSTAKNFPGKQLLREDATLRYYITSEEDNTSYVELKNDNVYINFYADFPTGNIKGMTMVTSTSDALEAERIMLFSKGKI